MSNSDAPRTTPSAPGDSASTPAEPDFWRTTDTIPAAPAASAATPADADQSRSHKPRGRSWIIASLIMNGVALVGAIVLPHFAAILVIAAAVCAWIGVRLSTGKPKLGVGSLIASLLILVGCVIYTIVAIQAGFTHIETVR